MLLFDCKIKGFAVSAVVDCGSPICILSNDVFNCISSAKQLFYICNNLKQSALLGMDFLRDNWCLVDFNGKTLQAGSIQVKLRNESSWEVDRVLLVETVTTRPDRKIGLVCHINRGMLESSRTYGNII